MVTVIAIAQSKGGAGKTSLTAHLACALGGKRTDGDAVPEAGPRKRVALVDLDPLMSLSKWFRLREQRLGPDTKLSIYTATGWRAQAEIEKAKRDNEIVLIDAPPQDEAALRAAVRSAMITLVPMQLSPMDLWATWPTLELIVKAGGRSMIVLNRVPPRARIADSLVQEMTKAGLPLSAASLGNRVAYASSLMEGRGVTETEPHSAAATEIRILAGEVLRRVAMEDARAAACASPIGAPLSGSAVTGLASSA